MVKVVVLVALADRNICAATDVVEQNHPLSSHQQDRA
jgi:hypothetical protein